MVVQAGLEFRVGEADPRCCIAPRPGSHCSCPVSTALQNPECRSPQLTPAQAPATKLQGHEASAGAHGQPELCVVLQTAHSLGDNGPAVSHQKTVIHMGT